MGPLPATLEDATKLVRDLGKKYIWIDSLCIEQDDAKDKSAQIDLMDLIYESAWLTIVTLSGTAADSELSKKDQLVTGSLDSCIVELSM